MNSLRCPRCNLTNWATEPACKRCGGPLGNSGEAYAPAFEPAGRYERSGTRAPQLVNPKSGMAIASMVLGIVSVLLGCLGGFLLAPVGLILGIISLVKSNRRPIEYGGKGFAIAGTILSGIGLLSIPFVMAIAIPNLLAARRAANEARRYPIVRTLASAEQHYLDTSGSCGDLVSLGSARLIDSVLAGGQKSGYQFIVKRTSSPYICEIYATPMAGKGAAATGLRSFFMSTEDNVLRAAEKHGQMASQSDPALVETSYTRR